VNAPTNPFGSFFPFLSPWQSEPQSFSQPILPGWTFGNIIVNGSNSSAPAAELAIVAKESYGRQIGKLLDAVAALIEQRADGKPPKAFTELIALREKVDKIKVESAKRSLEQITQDLQTLKDNNIEAYKAEVASLRKLLGAAD
jgi:hypothetical protein